MRDSPRSLRTRDVSADSHNGITEHRLCAGHFGVPAGGVRRLGRTLLRRPDKQICREFSQESGRDRPTPRPTPLESNRFSSNSLLNRAGNFSTVAGKFCATQGIFLRRPRPGLRPTPRQSAPPTPRNSAPVTGAKFHTTPHRPLRGDLELDFGQGPHHRGPCPRLVIFRGRPVGRLRGQRINHPGIAQLLHGEHLVMAGQGQEGPQYLVGTAGKDDEVCAARRQRCRLRLIFVERARKRG
jgi:hypothetical protein